MEHRERAIHAKARRGRCRPGVGFIAVLVGTAMIVAAFMINHRRRKVEVAQPTSSLVAATGKCAECHRRETSAVVHEYELSRRNEKGINCLEGHRPVEGQAPLSHRDSRSRRG